MAFKRKRSSKKAVLFRAKKRAPVRRSGIRGSRAPTRKTSFRRLARGKAAVSKPVFKGKLRSFQSSRLSKFRLAVLKATAVTNIYSDVSVIRATWNPSVQYSAMSSGSEGYLLDPATFINAIAARAANENATALGTSNAVTGFTQATPFDIEITGGQFQIDFLNQGNVDAFVTLYNLVARHDSVDTLNTLYSDCITNRMGDAGVSGSPSPGSPFTDVIPGSTIFNFHEVCQNFRVDWSKKFKLTPAQSRRFVFRYRCKFRITTRIADLQVLRLLTRVFHWNFTGAPVNRTGVNASNVYTGPGVVNVMKTHTTEYMIIPRPDHYVDQFQNNATTADFSVMTVNNPTVSTTFTAA